MSGEMKRCGTCKFWGRNVHERYGRGPAVNQTGEWRQCGRAKMYDSYEYGEKEADRDGELVLVEDGSDYHAAIKCRADFGCVLHEEK